MDYKVQVDNVEVSARVRLIAPETFEASGEVGGTTFIIRGISVDDALERFRRIAEEQRAQQHGS